MKAAKAFTIDRARWLRNGKGGCLMREDGCGCALGHYLVACGVSPGDMFGCAVPGTALPVYQRDWAPAWLFPRGNADGSLQIMALNDGKFSHSEAVREEKLVAAFAARGVELFFVGAGEP